MEQPSGMLKTAAALMSIVGAVFVAAKIMMAPKKCKGHQP